MQAAEFQFWDSVSAVSHSSQAPLIALIVSGVCALQFRRPGELGGECGEGWGGGGRQGNGEKLLEHLANGLMVFTLPKRVKGEALSSVPSHLGEQWMPCSSLGDQVTF